MAVLVAQFPSSLVFPLGKSSYTRKLHRTFFSWPAVCLGVLCIIAAAESQTFQYSRGWTNGKRSGLTAGPAASMGLVDLEGEYLSPESSDLGGVSFPGRIQMSLSPQGRLRTLDYNQYLARKLGVGSSGNLNTRKQPLWFGTIMGVDSQDPAAASQQSSSGSSSNSGPSAPSNDF